jgi:hypothetical protein
MRRSLLIQIPMVALIAACYAPEVVAGDWRKGVNNGVLNEWGRIFRDNCARRVNSSK